jgi:hypothetical protein
VTGPVDTQKTDDKACAWFKIAIVDSGESDIRNVKKRQTNEERTQEEYKTQDSECLLSVLNVVES